MENDTGGAGALAEGTTTTLALGPSTTAAPTTAAPPTTLPPATGDEARDGSTVAEGDAPGVERSTEGCDGGTYANHGAYVSSVAHDADRQPGDVAAAAQSECGKPLPSAANDAGDVAETPEPPDVSEPGPPDQGNGNGNGNGKGGGASGK
jgi:hypothetical protein